MEGLISKKEKFDSNEDKTKHGLLEWKENSSFWLKEVRVTVEEKRRSIGSYAMYCFGSSKENKSRYEIHVWNSNIC